MSWCLRRRYKQESDWPKYLVLRPELLIKLEWILALVNKAGIRADSFETMSGHRSPWYNRVTGNRTSWFRHLCGGAADIYTSVAPREGTMGNLNGGGLFSKADADFLDDLLKKRSTSTCVPLNHSDRWRIPNR